MSVDGTRSAGTCTRVQAENVDESGQKGRLKPPIRTERTAALFARGFAVAKEDASRASVSPQQADRQASDLQVLSVCAGASMFPEEF